MTVTYDYAGKVVLVTGGTKGIGAGIARAFQEAGATVVVCARTPPAGGTGIAVAGGDRGAESSRRAAVPPIRFVRADVRDPEDVARLISGFDRLDVVVNNAGGSPHAPLDGTSPRLHARVIELNLTAPLLVSQRAYPLLKASGGAVIMIGSASGTRPSPGTSAYGAAKAGLHHLARCLAAEWAPEVRVNSVVVGLAATENAEDHYEGGRAAAEATIPAGRMATPEDVARVCLWLGSPGYVTGAEIQVHGGGETPAWRWTGRPSTP
ncbi:SDR family oxidoreductase [Nonomuraea roseoviolacea subsp. roseoviolacea]|uniref:SDR family oxidoreductase n=1 Tax=Nonomuraea roseoviolacea TaxID=103837 RepID=UPI0031CF46E1